MEPAVKAYSKSEKSGSTALLLAMFLGSFGIHRFYVGKIGTGILMLVTFGGVGIWTLVDVVNIAYSNFRDDNGNYLEFEKRNEHTSSRVRKALLLIFGIFFVFLVSIFMLTYFATSGLTDVARAQLDAIRAHDYSKAYSYTSSQFQQVTTEEEFEQFVQAQPAMLDSKNSSFYNREIENDRGMISGTIEGKDGEALPVVYYFIKEEGVWKILSIELPSKMKQHSDGEAEEG